MKVLVIPDIHCKFDIAIKNITEHINEVDKVVCLGDYFDCFELNLKGQVSTKGFKKLMALTYKSRGKIDLLIGNHDFAYLDDPRVSGHQYDMVDEYRPLLLEAIDNGILKACVKYDGRVYSHAGISKAWVEMRYKKANYEEVIKRLNEDLIKKNYDTFKFYTYDSSMCGEHIKQSPLWIRPKSLMKSSFYPIQVVGHTELNPVEDKNSYIKRSEGGATVYFCDTRSHDHYIILDSKD